MKFNAGLRSAGEGRESSEEMGGSSESFLSESLVGRVWTEFKLGDYINFLDNIILWWRLIETFFSTIFYNANISLNLQLHRQVVSIPMFKSYFFVEILDSVSS